MLAAGRGRTQDALAHLEKSLLLGSADPVVWRNAAIATVNTGGDPGTADGYLSSRTLPGRPAWAPASGRLKTIRLLC
jgi:hypothetical protein